MRSTLKHDAKLDARYEHAGPAGRLRIDLGRRVRAARKAQNMTQVELAIRSGIAQPCVAAIEGGHRRVGTATVVRLFAALGEENPEQIAAEFKNAESEASGVNQDVAAIVNAALSTMGPALIAKQRETDPVFLLRSVLESMLDEVNKRFQPNGKRRRPQMRCYVTPAPGSVAAQVREHRLAQGWTQAQMANAAGVSRIWINFIETERRTPAPETLARILSTGRGEP